GREITSMPAAGRRVGLVFQEYALFPHLTVAQNIEYGLQVQKMSSLQRKNRLRDLLSLFELEALARREINQLSGGERQRTAIARALAPNPLVLLMDEPFSALDYNLRQRLQKDLLKIQKSLGFTAIFVTHQQEEALSLSDRLAVMQKGSISQIGSPEEIYERPSNFFVAEFLGDANLIPCSLDHSDNQSHLQIGSTDFWGLPELKNYPSGKYSLMFRPEDMELDKLDGYWTLPVKIIGLEYLGFSYRIEAIFGQYKIKALINKSVIPPKIGMEINLAVNPQIIRFLPE
ncbi:MAG TPA: polyamine ABC transporter ATP-binding protein, partial [Firmicutes bacterium]|nr:polyamine ABC transporter ATP-binding protein [Bacillota bacterium]